jgi:hypothetical protein
LDATSRVVGQARRFSEEIVHGVKRSTDVLKQLELEGLRQELDEMTVACRAGDETDQGTPLPRQHAQ